MFLDFSGFILAVSFSVKTGFNYCGSVLVVKRLDNHSSLPSIFILLLIHLLGQSVLNLEIGPL